MEYHLNKQIAKASRPMQICVYSLLFVLYLSLFNTQAYNEYQQIAFNNFQFLDHSFSITGIIC